MAQSEQPPDDGNPFDHVKVPEAEPAIEATVADIRSMPREEWDWVFYTEHKDEHIYSDAAVDVVMLR